MPLQPVDPLEQDERDALLAEHRANMAREDAYIAGLRDLANFLNENRDLIPTYTGVSVLEFPDPLEGETKLDAYRRLAGLLGPDAKLETPGTFSGHYRTAIKFGPHELALLLNPNDVGAGLPPHPLERGAVGPTGHEQMGPTDA